MLPRADEGGGRAWRFEAAPHLTTARSLVYHSSTRFPDDVGPALALDIAACDTLLVRGCEPCTTAAQWVALRTAMPRLRLVAWSTDTCRDEEVVGAMATALEGKVEVALCNWATRAVVASATEPGDITVLFRAGTASVADTDADSS